ncbi:hypothetical protein TIFTF001_003922 [Ficus carica]|uniref:Uncharacterized protein n=1 Tax=Ficus carica TaxID=3494 RepID=A0AA87ZHT1_FICCA|nr:hypothetical protein TIFTF001_003922 [Ficus carica]
MHRKPLLQVLNLYNHTQRLQHGAPGRGDGRELRGRVATFSRGVGAPAHGERPNDAELVEMIVKEVDSALKHFTSPTAKNLSNLVETDTLHSPMPTGLQADPTADLKEFESLLCFGSSDVPMIGLCGTDGITRQVLLVNALVAGNSYIECHVELLKSMLKYDRNSHPLLLKLLGSYLRDGTMNKWERTSNKLKTATDYDFPTVLKVCFEGLGEAEKEILLHLAFLKGKDKDRIERKLEESGTLFGRKEIQALDKKSFISIEGDGKETGEARGRNFQMTRIEYEELQPILQKLAKRSKKIRTLHLMVKSGIELPLGDANIEHKLVSFIRRTMEKDPGLLEF